VEEYEDEIGRDEYKMSVRAIRLRSISPKTLARMLRPPFNMGRARRLRMMYLPNRNLMGAFLHGTDLSFSILRWGNLFMADVSYAKFSDADLTHVNMRQTRGNFVSFQRANLRFAMLNGSVFRNGDFREANMRGALLRNVDFTNANLSGANLLGCTIENVTLDGVTVDNNTLGIERLIDRREHATR